MKMADPNDREIFAGISGIEFDFEKFELGQGIYIKKTYAHVFAPFMAAFKRAEKGKPHPAPWKSIKGGVAYDIGYELFIPIDFDTKNWFDRLNTVWWIIALMRLKCSSTISVPIISDISYSKISEQDAEPFFFTVETDSHRLFPEDKLIFSISQNELQWVKKYWQSAGLLMNKNESFNTAFAAIDRSIFDKRISIALMTLWGALERIFSPGHQELRFRIAMNIAAFIENPGDERLKLYKKVQKLYDARSKAAHGSPTEDIQEYKDTYELLKKCLIRMIEENKIPNQNDLENIILKNENVAYNSNLPKAGRTYEYEP